MKNIKYLFMIFLIWFSTFFNTFAAESIDTFSIKSIEPVAFNKVKLIFNANLEDIEDAKREFRIVNRNDASEELKVLETNIDEEDKKNLFVTFTKEAKVSWEYELTVLVLKDENWRNIESWIEWIAFFIMPAKFDAVVENNNTSVSTQEKLPNEETEWIDLNAGWLSTWDNPSLDGKAVNEKDVVKNTESEAKKTNKLPQTWPELLFIFILSLILGSLYFGFKLKRS